LLQGWLRQGLQEQDAWQLGGKGSTVFFPMTFLGLSSSAAATWSLAPLICLDYFIAFIFFFLSEQRDQFSLK
jgi:hypothetical protein